MTDADRIAVVRRHSASGRYYTLARLVDIDGQMLGLAVYDGAWYRQFRSKTAAFKAAREMGAVDRSLFEEERGAARAEPLRRIEG